jgi:putative membrane protein
MCCLPSVAQAANTQASDQKFLEKAYSINKGEIELGKLAQQRGTSQMVKDFGARLEHDHQKGLEQLREVAKKNDMTMPTSIKREESDLYTKLSRLHGQEFDREFSQHMVQGHGEAISLFESQAKNGQNRDLAKYAEDQLPVLRQHQSIAKRDLSRM